MGFLTDMDARARRLGIVETKLAQAAAIFFFLAIVKLVPDIMALSVWWFLGLSAACAVWPLVVFYRREPRES
jgi:hypothetical protein